MTVLYFEDSYADNIYNLEKKYLHQENILHGNLIAAAFFLFSLDCLFNINKYNNCFIQQ